MDTSKNKYSIYFQKFGVNFNTVNDYKDNISSIVFGFDKAVKACKEKNDADIVNSDFRIGYYVPIIYFDEKWYNTDPNGRPLDKDYFGNDIVFYDDFWRYPDNRIYEELSKIQIDDVSRQILESKINSYIMDGYWYIWKRGEAKHLQQHVPANVNLMIKSDMGVFGRAIVNMRKSLGDDGVYYYSLHIRLDDKYEKYYGGSYFDFNTSLYESDELLLSQIADKIKTISNVNDDEINIVSKDILYLLLEELNLEKVI